MRSRFLHSSKPSTLDPFKLVSALLRRANQTTGSLSSVVQQSPASRTIRTQSISDARLRRVTSPVGMQRFSNLAPHTRRLHSESFDPQPTTIKPLLSVAVLALLMGLKNYTADNFSVEALPADQQPATPLPSESEISQKACLAVCELIASQVIESYVWDKQRFKLDADVEALLRQAAEDLLPEQKAAIVKYAEHLDTELPPIVMDVLAIDADQRTHKMADRIPMMMIPESQLELTEDQRRQVENGEMIYFQTLTHTQNEDEHNTLIFCRSTQSGELLQVSLPWRHQRDLFVALNVVGEKDSDLGYCRKAMAVNYDVVARFGGETMSSAARDTIEKSDIQSITVWKMLLHNTVVNNQPARLDRLLLHTTVPTELSNFVVNLIGQAANTGRVRILQAFQKNLPSLVKQAAASNRYVNKVLQHPAQMEIELLSDQWSMGAGRMDQTGVSAVLSAEAHKAEQRAQAACDSVFEYQLATLVDNQAADVDHAMHASDDSKMFMQMSDRLSHTRIITLEKHKKRVVWLDAQPTPSQLDTLADNNQIWACKDSSTGDVALWVSEDKAGKGIKTHKVTIAADSPVAKSLRERAITAPVMNGISAELESAGVPYQSIETHSTQFEELVLELLGKKDGSTVSGVVFGQHFQHFNLSVSQGGHLLLRLNDSLNWQIPEEMQRVILSYCAENYTIYQCAPMLQRDDTGCSSFSVRNAIEAAKYSMVHPEDPDMWSHCADFVTEVVEPNDETSVRVHLYMPVLSELRAVQSMRADQRTDRDYRQQSLPVYLQDPRYQAQLSERDPLSGKTQAELISTNAGAKSNGKGLINRTLANFMLGSTKTLMQQLIDLTLEEIVALMSRADKYTVEELYGCAAKTASANTK